MRPRGQHTPRQPALDACAACCCSKPNEIEPSARGNGVIKRYGEREMDEAAAGTTRLPFDAKRSFQK